MSNKKLFLLDGHALVYRAHYAYIKRPLINSKGINTSAITGFVNTLWSILQNEKPTHLAVSFDMSGGTFRNEMYPEYKANRDAQPEDISIALPYIRDIITAFNIPIVMLQNYEADDIIGTLAKQAEKEDFTVYMMTPDKDYAQLVSDKVFMYKPARSGDEAAVLGVPEVLEKWGIARVDQVIDMLGLQGDSVDNIPGIKGVGPKTARKLLAKYDTVEGIIEHAHELKGKQKERVIEGAKLGILSKQLATIDINVPVQFDAKKYVVEPINREQLQEIFKDLEFRSLSKRILGVEAEPAAPQNVVGQQGNLFATGVTLDRATPKPVPEPTIVDKTIENTEHDYQLVDSAEKRAELIALLEQQTSISFDTETTGIDANEAELVGMSFSFEAAKGYYVPTPANQDEALAIVAEFKAVLENPNIEKIGQNIKYDALMMKWYDVELQGTYFDTMIAHYLCEPDLRHKLDYLSQSYLNYKMVPIEKLIGKRGKNQLSMRDIAVEKVSEYAAEDSDVTLQLKPVLSDMLKENESVKLFEELEMPLVRVLTNMEFEGVRIDGEFLNNYSKELAIKIKEKEESIYEKAGVRFNIASPKQVGQVLFEKMEIPYRWRKTKSGQYSTSEEKLSELALQHEYVQEILDFRKFSKLKSTYVDALPRLINPKTGRVHSSFNQARAATGRLSSENPNLQNIPIRDDAGREIRKAFIPRDENHILLAADYSQIELRLIAEIANEKAMLEAFQAGHDIHRATAAKVYGVELDKVTADQRRNAKTVNFSIIYGAGATNLSRQLNIKRKDAKILIDNYFAQYQDLKKYMDETVESCRKDGYVTTLMGRRRELRDINSRNALARTNAERVAINTPIQGSAADMIKVAMINIHKALKDGNFKTKMIMQVHDELVFDVYKPELETVKPIIENLMKSAIPNLQVPILVGMDVGENWLEAH
ncbi:MAG: DNA polymerase I [Saprospiraceae bacterium]